jgi:chorismate mutase
VQGRLTKDIGKLVAERAELADKVAGLQASVYKANEKLDGFKLLMNWNQEEMEQWALAQRQKEEDNLALDKYKKQDAAKVYVI